MKKYVLTETDGYSIGTRIFNDQEEAQEMMQQRYEALTPLENDESSAEMSYLDTSSGILYANGENVYVWNIKTVTFEQEREQGMSAERMKELLNSVINHISVANNTSDTVCKLLEMGFSQEELVDDFNFTKEDVETYASFFEEEHEEL